jgi:hypothetical protein
LTGDAHGKLVTGQLKPRVWMPLLEGEHLLYAVFNHVVRVVRDGLDVKTVLSVGDGPTVRTSLTWGILAGKAVQASSRSYRP